MWKSMKNTDPEFMEYSSRVQREADVEILGQRKRCIKHYGMEVYSYL